MSRSRRGRRKSQPKLVGGVLGEVLDDLGLGVAARALRVSEVWEEAVGSNTAAHARPLGLRGSTLEVSVETSVWCQQLQMHRSEILAALRAHMGEDAPAELRFLVGYTEKR